MKNGRNENWARPEEERQRNAARHADNTDIRSGRPARDARYAQDGTGRSQGGAGRESVPTRRKKSAVGARIIMYLIVFAFLLLLCGGIFAAYFFSTPDKIGSDMKFTYGGESVKVSEKTAYRDGRLFVSFSRIADMLSMSRTGSAGEARFILISGEGDAAGTGNEEYAVFTKDSAAASVSGTPVRLSASCFFSGDEVYVPADFVTTYMSGISVTEDTEKKKVAVERTMTAETDGEGDFVPYEVHFLLRAAKEPEKIDIGEAAYDPANVVFSTDLSAYESYMDPENAEEYLVLVNRENTVGADYVPEGLCDVINTRNDRTVQKMREYAAKSLEALYIEMKAAGYTDVSVTSAYRSYSYQEELYNGYIAREKANDPSLTDEQARAKVDTYSAAPGTSEHQTGLCCDMHNLPGADVSFAEEEVYAWLKQNAWKFGFIERFPENKTEITGYSFEPWHYRFVGRTAAAAIAGEGLCLEEYVERLAK